MPITLHQLTHPTRDVTLPCGGVATLHKLRSADWGEALAGFGRLLEAFAITLDRDPTEEEIRDGLGAVLMDAFAHPMGQESVTAFVGAFCDDVSADDLAVLDLGDWDALWGAIWEDNARPFVQQWRRYRKSGYLEAVRGAFATLQAMQTPGTPNSSPSSYVPELIPVTEPSSSTTSSTLPNSTGGGNCSSLPASAITPDSPGEPPCPGTGNTSTTCEISRSAST